MKRFILLLLLQSFDVHFPFTQQGIDARYKACKRFDGAAHVGCMEGFLEGRKYGLAEFAAVWKTLNPTAPFTR